MTKQTSSKEAGTPRPLTFQPDIYGKVVDMVSGEARCRILDVGAGQGYLSRLLADAGREVAACDCNPDAFLCPDVPFTACDLGEQLPYECGAFGCTVAVEVAEHVENHFHFVRELVRVTAPGGLIILTTPNVLSLPSRWHFLLYGYTDCSPLPLRPDTEKCFMQHINPVSLPEILFCLERSGADLVRLTTNRLRRGAFLPMLLYPLFALALRAKLSRHRNPHVTALHKQHIRWMLSPANLMGRITIAVARKRTARHEGTGD